MSSRGPGSAPGSTPAASSKEAPMSAEDGTAILAIAAHELKNALGGIGVALARCEMRLRSGQAVTAEDLALGRGELRRLSALVNDLLDGARVDLGAVHVQPARVDAGELTREVVDMFRAARGKAVVLNLPARPLLLDADAERVRAVLINYLENAVKYAPDSPVLTVTVGPSPVAGRARIAVQDQGAGIQPEDQARLFQRFFRAPGVMRRIEGLGLGLYVCRSIAEAHHGAVGVDSPPGRGATFWLDLPLPGSVVG
jgi:signal transduction histidine kinase